MYDKVLGKDKFWEEFKKAGATDEEILQEWQKLERLFEVSLVQAVFERMPVNEQDELRGKLDISMPEDAKELVVKVKSYMDQNTEKVNAEDCVKRAVVISYGYYDKLVNGGN